MSTSTSIENGSPAIPTTPFPVRLPRGSSAHFFLGSLSTKKKSPNSHDAFIHSFAEELQYDVQKTKQMSKVKSALYTMKRLNEAIGRNTDNLPKISESGQLEFISAEPALKLLRVHTWREFFNKNKESMKELNGSNKKLARPQSAKELRRSNSELTPLRPTNLSNNSTLNSTEHQHDFSPSFEYELDSKSLEALYKEKQQLLSNLHNNLVMRTKALWQELKIPDYEKEFYKKELFRNPPESVYQCEVLAAHIEALETHKICTKQTLQAIREREAAIYECFDILTAICRKGTTVSSSLNHNPVDDGHTHDQLLHSFSRLNLPNNNLFWKEELITSLHRVRMTSLKVIQCVQRWRRDLWRPLPFNWKGVNYIDKMLDDMLVLKSENIMQLLHSMHLSVEDLQCIIFFPVIEEGDVKRSNKSKDDHGAEQVHSKIADKTDQRNIENEVHNQSGNHTPFKTMQSSEIYHTEQISNNEQVDLLLTEFRTIISGRELATAAKVVLQEQHLQRAIAQEQTALREKGVFIPLLRMKELPKVPSSAEDKDQQRSPSGTLKHLT